MKRTQIGVLILALVVSAFLYSGSANAFAPFRTVTFHENTYAGDPVTATQTRNSSGPLTAFASLNPSFSNSGYTFIGWNTSPDRSGTGYANSQIFSFTATMSLYAMWQRQYHTVTFHENSFQNDSLSCTQSANISTSLTLEANLCSTFVNTGFRFSGWSTSSDGTGLSFNDGAQFSFESNLDLYVVWTSIPTNTISFDSNGATQIMSSVTGLNGSTITIPDAGSLSRTGYTFAGWNYTQDGTGSVIFPGAQYKLLTDLNLWAMWTPNVYSVQYLDSRGATLSASETYQVGSAPLILPFPTKTGYTFLGWFDQISSGSQVGLGGGSFTPTTSCILYGKWQVNTFTVTLDPKGGSVYRQSYSYVYGSPALQLPTPTKVGYLFDGWYWASNMTVLVGSGGAFIYPDASETLVAKWTPCPSFSISYDANGGITSALEVVINSGDSFRLPTITSTSNTGKVLAGWSTDPTSTIPTFAPDQVVTPVTSVRYFAIWFDSVPWQVFGTVGIFDRQKSSLTNLMKRSIRTFVNYIRLHKSKSVEILGYTPFSGNATFDASLSASRAREVAKYLMVELRRMKLSGVSVIQAGEGSLPKNTSVLFATVEMLLS